MTGSERRIFMAYGMHMAKVFTLYVGRVTSLRSHAALVSFCIYHIVSELMAAVEMHCKFMQWPFKYMSSMHFLCPPSSVAETWGYLTFHTLCRFTTALCSDGCPPADTWTDEIGFGVIIQCSTILASPPMSEGTITIRLTSLSPFWMPGTPPGGGEP